MAYHSEVPGQSFWQVCESTGTYWWHLIHRERQVENMHDTVHLTTCTVPPIALVIQTLHCTFRQVQLGSVSPAGIDVKESDHVMALPTPRTPANGS
jgi:hypothetical protein